MVRGQRGLTPPSPPYGQPGRKKTVLLPLPYCVVINTFLVWIFVSLQKRAVLAEMKERIAVKRILLLSRRLKRVRQFCKSVPFTSLQLSNLKTTECKGKSPSCPKNKFSSTSLTLSRTVDWTITEPSAWVTSFLQNGQKADSYFLISRNHVLTFFEVFFVWFRFKAKS